MKYCEQCGKEVKTTNLCKSCSVKKTKKEWPKLFENIDNKLCNFGCEQIAKYQYKNGSIGCSKGVQYCPEVCRKNSKNTKGKPSGMLGKHHSEETKQTLKEKNIGNIGWNKGLTKETDERVKRISEFHVGKIISEETRLRISISSKNSEKMKLVKSSKEYRDKLSKSLTGRIISDEAKKNMSIARKNSEKLKRIMKSDEYRSNMSKSTSGSKNGNYQGIGKYTSYKTYSNKLDIFELIRRNPENKNIIDVKCTYCNRWFSPTSISTNNRLFSFENKGYGEQRFYCSNDCKNLCDIYRQEHYPKSTYNKSEVDPSLRKLVFERDNWTCKKCDTTSQLECHHIDPVALEPLFQNDIDSCITLCSKCHKWIHMNVGGCRYHEIREIKQIKKQGC